MLINDDDVTITVMMMTTTIRRIMIKFIIITVQIKTMVMVDITVQ